MANPQETSLSNRENPQRLDVGEERTRDINNKTISQAEYACNAIQMAA